MAVGTVLDCVVTINNCAFWNVLERKDHLQKLHAICAVSAHDQNYPDRMIGDTRLIDWETVNIVVEVEVQDPS